jgi:PadR family transcriptional regulator PadR
MVDMTDFPRRVDLLQGTLDMLILKALTAGPMHGYGVARWLERTAENTLRVEEGSLYPALTRMAERGWVSRAWGVSENNRRARFYSLTEEGERQLRLETATWSTFTGAVAQVLDSEPG